MLEPRDVLLHLVGGQDATVGRRQLVGDVRRQVGRQLGRAEDVDWGQLFPGLPEAVLAGQEVVGQVADDEDEVSERRRTIRKRDVSIRSWSKKERFVVTFFSISIFLIITDLGHRTWVISSKRESRTVRKNSLARIKQNQGPMLSRIEFQLQWLVNSSVESNFTLKFL